MKKLLVFLLIGTIFIGCNTKKTETTSTIDSVAIDSVVLADIPAPSSLAFEVMTGYTVKNVPQADSVNFVLLTSQEDLDKNFKAENSTGNEVKKPDFIINYIIGMTCLPSQLSKTIAIEKTEIQGEEINVYVNIQAGAKQNIARAAMVFAVERRDGIGSIQFYVNGKKGQSFFMTGM